MSTSDLYWADVDADLRDEQAQRLVEQARVAASDVWPFLASATSREDYLNRKALADDRIVDAVSKVANGDPAIHATLYPQVVESFDEDFNTLHEAREREAFKTAERERGRRGRDSVGRGRREVARARREGRQRKTAAVSESDLEAVLAAMKQAFGGYFYDLETEGPVDGWEDGLGNEVYHSIENGVGRIAWEAGPYTWTYLFPHGGIDEEMTRAGEEFGAGVARIPDVSDAIPDHLFVEAETHYSIQVYDEGGATASRRKHAMNTLLLITDIPDRAWRESFYDWQGGQRRATEFVTNATDYEDALKRAAVVINDVVGSHDSDQVIEMLYDIGDLASEHGIDSISEGGDFGDWSDYVNQWQQAKNATTASRKTADGGVEDARRRGHRAGVAGGDLEVLLSKLKDSMTDEELQAFEEGFKDGKGFRSLTSTRKTAARCEECGGTIDRDDGSLSGWTHRSDSRNDDHTAQPDPSPSSRYEGSSKQASPSSYAGDPYWLDSVRYPSECHKCGAPIKKGERAWYWPRAKKLECEDCGEASSRKFDSEVADEDFMNRTYSRDSLRWAEALKQKTALWCPRCGGDGDEPDGQEGETCHLCGGSGDIDVEDIRRSDVDYYAKKRRKVAAGGDPDAVCQECGLDLYEHGGRWVDETEDSRNCTTPSGEHVPGPVKQSSRKVAFDVEQLRRIVEGHQYEESEAGSVIDAVSANTILTVYDALSEDNREKFAALPVEQAAEVAWKLVAARRGDGGDTPFAQAADGERVAAVGRRTKEAQLHAHLFGSTSTAYNQCQVSDRIKDGDILTVPSEGVFGFLYEAWPIAVTAEVGSFHTVDDRQAFLADNPQYAGAWDEAETLALQHGASIREASKKTGSFPLGYDDSFPVGHASETFFDHSGDPIVFHTQRYQVLGRPGTSYVVVGVKTRQTTQQMAGTDAALVLSENGLTNDNESRGRIGGRFNVIPIGTTASKFRIEVEAGNEAEAADSLQAMVRSAGGEDVRIERESSEGTVVVATSNDMSEVWNSDLSQRIRANSRWTNPTFEASSPGQGPTLSLNCDPESPVATDHDDCDGRAYKAGPGWVTCECDCHDGKESSKTAETHAPYSIQQDGDKWKVVNDIGETKGTHDTKEEAREHQKALYANVPGASEQAEKKSSSKLAAFRREAEDEVMWTAIWMVGDETFEQQVPDDLIAQHTDWVARTFPEASDLSYSRPNTPTEASLRKGAPFADYEDFDDCVSKNSDKDSPEGYCGEIKRRTEGMRGGQDLPVVRGRGEAREGASGAPGARVRGVSANGHEVGPDEPRGQGAPQGSGRRAGQGEPRGSRGVHQADVLASQAPGHRDAGRGVRGVRDDQPGASHGEPPQRSRRGHTNGSQPAPAHHAGRGPDGVRPPVSELPAPLRVRAGSEGPAERRGVRLSTRDAAAADAEVATYLAKTAIRWEPLGDGEHLQGLTEDGYVLDVSPDITGRGYYGVIEDPEGNVIYQVVDDTMPTVAGHLEVEYNESVVVPANERATEEYLFGEGAKA